MEMDTRRMVSVVATSVFGLLGATNANALESGFYAGALVGQTEVDIDTDALDAAAQDPGLGIRSTVDDSDTGFGVFVGWQFGRWFALEAQYADLGKAGYRADQTITNFFPTAPRDLTTSVGIATDSSAISLSGVATIPLGEQFAVGVRLGAARSEVKYTTDGIGMRGTEVLVSLGESDTRDNVAAVYGVSLEWDPIARFGMRLEWQEFKDVGKENGGAGEDDTDGFDVTLLSLSAIGRF
jgi:OOP family OmpA-OmpF porin